MSEGFRVWLRNARKKRGLTTRELSFRIGKSSSYITRLENGFSSLPSLEVSRKIMDALGEKNGDNILRHYCILKDGEEVEEIDDVAKKRQNLIDYISNEIQHLDIEQLEALDLFFKDQSMFVKIIELQNQGIHLDAKIPAFSLAEFIDFLHQKYVTERLNRLFDK